MLTLRDCFMIATLFAIPLAMLNYTPLSGFFLFIPASFGVWMYVARRNMTETKGRKQSGCGDESGNDSCT